jgi:hypothetical protein
MAVFAAPLFLDLALCSLGNLVGAHRPKACVPQASRLAVAVPAHGEELMVARAVASVLAGARVSLGARLRTLSFCGMNGMREGGSACLGFSTGLRGRSLAVTSATLARLPLRTDSIAEEVEHHKKLFSAGLVSAGNSRFISFNDLLNPAKSLEGTLQPGEMIYVPESGFYRATCFLERLSPVSSLATRAILA